MKLRNKKTGEIAPASNIAVGIGKDGKWYDSLAELNEEWEDAPEEPKYFYCISTDGSINKYEVERYAHDSWCINGAKIIGNYFETKEEAEQVVEKDIAYLRKKVAELNDEKIFYKSEVAYLKGKIEAYEWFLREQGFIKGNEK